MIILPSCCRLWQMGLVTFYSLAMVSRLLHALPSMSLQGLPCTAKCHRPISHSSYLSIPCGTGVFQPCFAFASAPSFP